VFDQDANGYVRSDTVACIFLQRAKNERRIYAQIINTKVNSDGFKKQGINFPSTVAQKQLLEEIYEESGVHSSKLGFLEAHGTGTQAGDFREVEAITLWPKNATNLSWSVRSSQISATQNHLLGFVAS
jgi:fatty acid synthase